MRSFLIVLALLAAPLTAQKMSVASKQFTESHILGEVVAQLAEGAGATVDHRQGLGDSPVVWGALRAGEIDAYVEYTGTAMKELFDTKAPKDLHELEQLLNAEGVTMGPQLGFNNTYALGMKEELAEQLGIETISDLVSHPNLEVGFSIAFVDRPDGWPGLQQAYGLPQTNVRGLKHALAYEALESGQIALTDLYSTDAEIEKYNLRILKDDRAFFPEYKAVIFYRTDLQTRAPDVLKAWQRLEGNVPAHIMVSMNAAILNDKHKEKDVAGVFLEAVLPKVEAGEEVEWPKSEEVSLDDRISRVLDELPRLTIEHLWMVFLSLFAAVIVAIPLGVIAHRKPRLGQGILGFTGILQTVPSIALLVLLIPVFGIGWWPAVVALFLYSLLPIVRNTHAGLSDIDPTLLESADALGFTRLRRLRLIELPLSGRSILAGIKIAAVINVGTATLGGFIGAGGYGEAIFAGISRQDNVQILSGAIPAALLAIVVQLLFEVLERLVVPRGLRLTRD